MGRLEKARRIEEAALAAAETESTDGAGRDPWRPAYHVTPPVGWMNDPNGFSFYGGKAHLFFQYNPYRPRWGPMHWGHVATADFVSWERLPAALAPDRAYDGLMGCFSGTALSLPAARGSPVGDELVLMYTGVSLLGRQQQCLARSRDGIDFSKEAANPVIRTRDLPPFARKGAFRDPKLFARDGAYYCLVGARDKRTGTGMLLLYRSTDLRAWSYVNEAYSCSSADMIECPDLARTDGQDVLIYSPTNHPAREDGFANLHASVYSIGELDTGSGAFRGGEYREIDGGFDFYAPQTAGHPDGRVVMIAWMQMWKRSMPTAERGLGWAGAMTLPRELSIRGGVLLQAPAREIEAYRADRVVARGIRVAGSPAAPVTVDGVAGNRLELRVEADLGSSAAFEIRLFVGTEHRTVLRYEKDGERIALDRGRSGVPIRELGAGGAASAVRRRRYRAEGGRLRVRVFLDRSTVEVFLGDGELALSAVVYPDAGDEGIEFAAEGGDAELIEVEKWTIAAGSDRADGPPRGAV